MNEGIKKTQNTHGSEKNEAQDLKTIELAVDKNGSRIISHGEYIFKLNK
ncbi:Uncharacterised protein [Staphylococcus hominis]|nr:hypothetical protein [Staphylococcus hominis]SUM42095.1 Uncharacterised protein [Staphylococcus hominis]